MNENRVGQILMIAMMLIWVIGVMVSVSWISYLIGSIITYVLCSIVLNKYQLEIESAKNYIESIKKNSEVKDAKKM